MTENILAIVVTYHPKIQSLKVMFEACLSQLSHIVVVDNASNNISELKQLAEQFSVPVIQQESNTGLGAAHNVGIDYAQREGFDYVLLLDQDSVPMQSMVEKLLEAHKIKSKLEPISATGVSYLNADNGYQSFFIRFGWLKFQRKFCSDRDVDGCVGADFLISSGSLISLSALKEVGTMDETLFIDHVDTEWFLRAHNKGYKAYGVCDAMMQHGLGETTHQLNLKLGKLGRQRNVPQHKPFRYYYIFRNSILLYRRGYVSARWRWNDLQRLFMIAMMFGLFRAPRKQNVAMMLRGIVDGIKGKTGQLVIADR